MAGAAPPGNKNGTKPKMWADAIRRAAAQDPDQMRRIALKLLEMAEGGDISAMRELGDRLEGKPKQQIEASGTDGGPLMVQVLRFTDYLADDPAAK